MMYLATVVVAIMTLLSWITPPPTGPQAGEAATYETQFRNSLNEVRAKINLQTLTADPRLYAAAKRYAYQYLASDEDCDNKYVDLGVDWSKRFEQVGYATEGYGILLACGWASADTALYSMAIYDGAELFIKAEAEDMAVVYQWSYLKNKGVIMVILAVEGGSRVLCQQCDSV